MVSPSVTVLTLAGLEAPAEAAVGINGREKVGGR